MALVHTVQVVGDPNIMAGKRFKVETTTGFADRIRVLFSYLQRTRANGNTLVVCWMPNRDCPGRYLDHLEPIPNVEFTDDPKKPHYRGYDFLKPYDPFNNYYFHDMIPRPRTQVRIDEVMSRLTPSYLAVHARRTDKIPATGRDGVTRDEEFFEWLDSELRPDEKLFLATDNLETQIKFTKHYGDRVVFTEDIEPSGHLRQTSLESTVVDWFVCVNARQFEGTRYSGLSGLLGVAHRHRLQEKEKAAAEAAAKLEKMD